MDSPIAPNESATLYLDLMERCLCNTIYEDAYTDWRDRNVPKKFDSAMRELGRDWPSCAHTMIGQSRLRNLRTLTEQALAEGVEGDFIETGVWRGGACILVRAVLQAHGVRDRRVFAADSFEGLPRANAELFPADAGDNHHTFEELAVSLPQVKANFASYGLLDEQVVFLKGWFKDTLPNAPIDKLAILRLDGDMYESTIEALESLYDKVSAGGFVIVDDYGCVVGCQKAVDDFRRARNIGAPLVNIDGWGVYWRKTEAAAEAALPVRRMTPISDSAGRPFWSVIVPLYERQTYLRQCLDSILDRGVDQDEMEIIVVDDASPTDQRKFVETSGRGRVRYVRNATNLGLYPSVNAILPAARGRWIHFLHDDDWVSPDFYSIMRQGVEQAPPSIGMAQCRYATWHETDGATWLPQPLLDHAGTLPRDFLMAIARSNCLNIPAVIVRRETFENVGLFREDIPFTADWEWYVRSTLQFDWHYQPEVLASYRVHAGSQTNDLHAVGRTAQDIRRTLGIIASNLPADIAATLSRASGQHHARHFLDAALACLQAGNHKVADRFIHEAVAIDPAAARAPEFANLLQHPAASPLCDDIRSLLLRRSV